MTFDIAIIGGGPAGYNAAAAAAGKGLKTVLFEKNKVVVSVLMKDVSPQRLSFTLPISMMRCRRVLNTASRWRARSLLIINAS